MSKKEGKLMLDIVLNEEMINKTSISNKLIPNELPQDGIQNKYKLGQKVSINIEAEVDGVRISGIRECFICDIFLYQENDGYSYSNVIKYGIASNNYTRQYYKVVKEKEIIE